MTDGDSERVSRTDTGEADDDAQGEAESDAHADADAAPVAAADLLSLGQGDALVDVYGERVTLAERVDVDVAVIVRVDVVLSVGGGVGGVEGVAGTVWVELALAPADSVAVVVFVEVADAEMQGEAGPVGEPEPESLEELNGEGNAEGDSDPDADGDTRAVELQELGAERVARALAVGTDERERGTVRVASCEAGGEGDESSRETDATDEGTPKRVLFAVGEGEGTTLRDTGADATPDADAAPERAVVGEAAALDAAVADVEAHDVAPREGCLALVTVADEPREALTLGDKRPERCVEVLLDALRDGATDRDSLGNTVVEADARNDRDAEGVAPLEALAPWRLALARSEALVARDTIGVRERDAAAE